MKQDKNSERGGGKKAPINRVCLVFSCCCCCCCCCCCRRRRRCRLHTGCFMARHEDSLDAIKPNIPCGEGDEWQEEWDDILEEVFWDSEGPKMQQMSPHNATLESLNSGQQKDSIVNTRCKSSKKRTKKKSQRSKSGHQHRSHHTNSHPTCTTPTIQLLQQSFTFGRPQYNPCVLFQTPHGCGTFYCFCWKYHNYHQRRILKS
jgi:hypothetical protein